ncbi:hypothetical protein [Pseudomonas xantholysinigenes]|uniref:Uncharacterized protein n=1 Tax=Pseudomonas xantholysinigenes TaxID=2745490 RepID=A0A9E6TV40_9PSED|nr:hypothetical protein [Pseudomonas xantholysinigenes]QXI36893.1 hypothetical protein HU772_016235 [Pseudomonas xantholysinigenes]
MDGRRLELVGSLDLKPTLDKVQDGIVLDFAQYSLLREAADAKLYQLMARMQGNPRQQAPEDLRRLQDACLRVAHLMQTSCLALRRLQLDRKDQRLARAALEAQLAYMQACLRRSLVSFDELA